MSSLFNSYKIGSLSLKNRVVMSPMCQFEARDGFVNDWHFVHYGSRAVGGCGTIMIEATAISPEGRISYGDLGLWNDDQINGLAHIVSFVKRYGATTAIQLAHAGRKASCDIAWTGGKQLIEGDNSWQTVSSSPIPFYETDRAPLALTKDCIKEVVDDFRKAAKRAIKAGFSVLEIHAAHGYLIHQFLSPLTNQRSDEYGGMLENRARFLLEVVDAVQSEISSAQSLWVRISATDWVDGGWDLESSVELSKLLKEKGVDLVDVSTGGNLPDVKIPVAPNYQVPFAETIKKEVGIKVGAVGLITTSKQAEELLDNNKCDLVFIGRELLRNPYFVADSVFKETGDKSEILVQYGVGYK